MGDLNEQDSVWDLMVCHFEDVLPLETNLAQEVNDLEKSRITLALDQNNGNRTKAAKMLGIGRTLLIHKIKKYNLD